MDIPDSVQAICCICKGDADYECVKCGRGVCEACANYVAVLLHMACGTIPIVAIVMTVISRKE